ncbi:leucine-rich repeat domain-containing protein [Streptomyces chartreusis]|uniref:hypothetical protein n=1 Tax=Streptomyces chartreusis TaxID=1969 RepID=UPI003652222F
MIDFGAEIEQVLDGPPSRLAFRAVCAALLRAGCPERLVSRCEERLASWPDEVREAPWSWLAALKADHSKPTWRLVRALAPQSVRNGTVDPALPDPRSCAEVRGVTRLDLGWYASEQLEVLAATLDHWKNLRSVRIGGLTGSDGELVARIAGHDALTRLESLSLVGVDEDMWHFEKPPFSPPEGRTWQLRHVGLRAPDLVRLLRSGQVPNLRSVDVLVCSAQEALELTARPELARLDRLAIGFRCGKNGRQPLWKPYFGNVIDEDDDAAEAFFARADLTGLRSLVVRGTPMGLGREGLGERGVDAIVAGGVLRQLTELTLELLPVGDAVIARVLEGIDAERIEKLALTDLVATDRTATALAAAGVLPRLRHLDLSRNRLGAEGARQLAAGVRLPALEHLDLGGRESGSPYYARPDIQPVGDDAAEAWASSDNAAKLTHLRLAATGLSSDGLAALMTSERLPELGTLDVACNPVGSWPTPLQDAAVWRTVRSLNLADCGLGDTDVRSLASTASAPRLHSVSLAYNSVGSQGARALAAWALLPQLWALDLHDNVIGDDGLTDLATSGAAQRLLELDLEQDCWNPRARDDRKPLPAEIVDPASFPSLDTIFLGMVDEYHGSRYSCGFPTRVREEIVSAPDTRPELIAFLTHLETDGFEDDEDDTGPDEDRDPDDHDFRTERAARHAELFDEARDFARRMFGGDIGWPPPKEPAQGAAADGG